MIIVTHFYNGLRRHRQDLLKAQQILGSCNKF